MIEELSHESCRVAADKMALAIPRLIKRGYVEIALNMMKRREQLLRRAAGLN